MYVSGFGWAASGLPRFYAGVACSDRHYREWKRTLSTPSVLAIRVRSSGSLVMRYQPSHKVQSLAGPSLPWCIAVHDDTNRPRAAGYYSLDGALGSCSRRIWHNVLCGSWKARYRSVVVKDVRHDFSFVGLSAASWNSVFRDTKDDMLSS